MISVATRGGAATGQNTGWVFASDSQVTREPPFGAPTPNVSPRILPVLKIGQFNGDPWKPLNICESNYGG